MEKKDTMGNRRTELTIVIPSPPPELLEDRRQKGIDRRDEMWEGALHVPPMPSCDHQDFSWHLEAFLRGHLRGRRIRVLGAVNVASLGGWPRDFRIPDMVLLGPDCRGVNRRTHIEGPPDVVIEIASPGDESREKLPFWARIGVPEVWIIDRDSKDVEIRVLREGAYAPVTPDREGWTGSPFAGIEARPEGGKLLLRRAGEASTEERLPED